MTASVCTGALRVEVFDWKIPFDHTIVPSFESTEYLVALLSLEISFLISGLLFVPVVRIRVWDYAATVTFVHMCMCCIVTGKFPLMWQWWVEIGSGFLLMLSFGMTLAYFATKRQPREFPVDV
ncbi:putative transmembrane protein 244 [Ascaphus truei]